MIGEQLYDRFSVRPFEMSSLEKNLEKRDFSREETYVLNDVDDWDLCGVLDGAFTVLLSNQRPELVEVQSWGEAVVAVQVEVSHSNLSEVTWMVLVEVDSVMVHATSVTTTSGMLTVLA